MEHPSGGGQAGYGGEDGEDRPEEDGNGEQEKDGVHGSLIFRVFTYTKSPSWLRPPHLFLR